jgi:programmed cell death 6-interacting protein
MQHFPLYALQASAELRACGEMLDEEQASDETMRGRHGHSWTRPPSRVAAASYRENIARYEANLHAAADSDSRNAIRLNQVQANLAKLSPEAVRGKLPALQAPMVSPGVDADQVTSNLRRIISQLDALGQERGALEETLRGMRDGDNTLQELLQCGAGNEERVFQTHLGKLREYEGPITQNATRTNEAIALLSDYASAFRKLYDVDSWLAECQRVAGAALLLFAGKCHFKRTCLRTPFSKGRT